MNAKHEQSTQKNALADSLLELDCRKATSTADGRALAGRVLRRDRLRVRLLTGATIVFFLLAVIGIYWNFHLANTQIMPKFWKYSEEALKHKPTGVELTTAYFVQELYMSQMTSIWIASAAVAALLVAAVCTVLLVMATRRATLRQIQVSLLVLSEQFDTLQRSLHGSRSTGGGQATQEPDA